MDTVNQFDDVNYNCESSFSIGLYSIWDTQLKQFDNPFSCSKAHVNDYVTMLVNDVSNKFFGKEDNFILMQVGYFNNSTGEVVQCQPVNINLLSVYINQRDRNLQTIVQTLNYLPSGYFKMPAEQKQEIQKSIDDALQKYISDYVVPDIDISSEKIKYLENKIKELEAVNN